MGILAKPLGAYDIGSVVTWDNTGKPLTSWGGVYIRGGESIERAAQGAIAVIGGTLDWEEQRFVSGALTAAYSDSQGHHHAPGSFIGFDHQGHEVGKVLETNLTDKTGAIFRAHTWAYTLPQSNTVYQGTLAEDFVDSKTGATFRQWTVLSRFSNGQVRYGTLAQDWQDKKSGMVFQANSSISFNENGSIESGVMGVEHRFKHGCTLQAGETFGSYNIPSYERRRPDGSYVGQ